MKVWLRFLPDMVDKPVLSDALRHYDVDFNILRANIAPNGGELLLDIEGENIKDFIKYVEKNSIEVKKVKKVVKKDEDKCVNCGGCVSLCPVKAILITENWEIELDDKICIGCGFCADSCPTKAIKLS